MLNKTDDMFTIPSDQFDAVAIKTSSSQITWEELTKRIISLKIHLQKLGFQSGDKCAILAEPSAAYVETLLAMWSMGLIAVPMNTRLPDEQIVAMLHSINCLNLFCDGHRKIPNGLQTYPVKIIERLETELFKVKFQLDNPATIIFTSGSTGDGKACLHSFANHYFSALGSNENIELHPGDSWLLSLPLYHVAGIAILFRCLLTGAAIAIPSAAHTMDDNLATLKPTHLSLVATQLQHLLKNSTNIPILQSSFILLGGSATPINLLKRALDLNLCIYKSYGSTEMSSQITTTRPNDSIYHFKTSGTVLPYREIKIQNDEILVRGKTLFQGYVHENKVTPAVDQDGWYHTKDLGRIDPDGYLTVLGRKDNMFISGGENIHPEEIERAVEALEEIEQAIVIPVVNEKFGHRPAAFVRFKTGYFLKDLNIEELRLKIAKFKIPDHFFEWPDIEEGLKPNRKNLQKLAEQLLQN